VFRYTVVRDDHGGMVNDCRQVSKEKGYWSDLGKVRCGDGAMWPRFQEVRWCCDKSRENSDVVA
jgi:hypothetical protein